jgi:SPP1 gp7 family putative phage head morphogenesis protein
MPKKPKTARAVSANRGLEAKYRKALLKLVDEMQSSLEYWLTAAYREAPPRMAQDASPVNYVNNLMRGLALRWQRRFDVYADKLADYYVNGMFRSSDRALRQSLKDAGWSVDFEMTQEMRDALNATIAENVGLIRSIPQQYLQQVEGVVMRSYTQGRDLETMVKDLKALYPNASHRAELIARDQSNKANATVQRTRQMELGITEAIWMHSHAGKKPRPDHVAANGKKYRIAEGCLISGEYIQPGYEINCRCTSRPVLPF